MVIMLGSPLLLLPHSLPCREQGNEINYNNQAEEDKWTS